MRSTDRRTFLTALGTAGTPAIAGCSAFTNGAADVDPHTGLDRDPSDVLDDTPVFLAGETADLPDPPTTTDSLADADLVLATADADREWLAFAFRTGKPIAFARGGCQDALAGLLDAVGDDYRYGTESVIGRPVEVAAAVPAADTATTYTFVDDGWNDSVLDPVGWVERSRLPNCATFVPESSADSAYEYAGSAFVVGRLETDETYASRTIAQVRTFDDHQRRVRLRTKLHAAANDGYPVGEARRVADFPNDESLLDQFPNGHERNGVEVRNYSDPIEARLEVSFGPTNDRARGALTGCCGLTTDGEVAYDHRTRWTWTNDRLLGSDTHYGGGSGRGEWHLDA